MGGWNYNTRSAEQVQRDNGQNYDFNKIAKWYADTVPLRGKRAHLDVRPHGERNRSWERIVKVSDNEYFLTNTAYRYWDRTNVQGYAERNKELGRAITYKLDGDTEYVTVHAPRRYWGDDMNKPFLERQLMGSYAFIAPSTYYFYDNNLPSGVSITKWGTKPYICLLDQDAMKYKSYSLGEGDIVLARKVGEKQFSPIVVHKEFKRRLDREKTKALREKIKPLLSYVMIMSPLVERHDTFGNVLELICTTGEGDGKLSWEDIIEPKGEDVPEAWLELTRRYKSKVDRRTWNYSAQTYDIKLGSEEAYRRIIYNDVYKIAKPIKEIEVELGEPFKNNKYHSW